VAESKKPTLDVDHLRALVAQTEGSHRPSVAAAVGPGNPSERRAPGGVASVRPGVGRGHA
jgi:hypothetical protein